MLPARRFNGQYGLTDFFNDFFDGHSIEKVGTNTPAVNVVENEKEYKIEVAAPGMCKDDFKIHINKQGNLVIDMENEDFILDLTEEERIDIITKRVLDKYLPAFKELAK